MQLKLFVHTGPKGSAPMFKSREEVWLVTSEDMMFYPYEDNEYELDHEVYIPDGYDVSVVSFFFNLYIKMNYRDNVISKISLKMYEWSPGMIFIRAGEPIVQIKLTSLSA
ncbi:E4 ORF F fiber protein [Bovine adenovirus 2]|uniref:E4 ORF F fiber protein n=1 Tax=Bovine adenovirus 2 TaxID=114429 RepID=A0A9W4C0X0_ADEB2|nr:E4 ORF F fiber protein [Bovine adenovirus 2]